MKTILYMAVSVDGLIAKENGNTDFVSKEDWKMWEEISKRAGNVIFGRKTYETMQEAGLLPLENRTTFVLTHKKLPNTEGVIFTDQTPKEILASLQEQGVKEVFIAGGGELNASFLAEGLVDELYLTISPTILGKGIGLFAGNTVETALELVETVTLSKNEVQLRYRVKKA